MKPSLRTHWIHVRNQIQTARRKQAETQLFKELKLLTKGTYTVLSFTSFRSEISMTAFNEYLAYNDRLCLPKMHENQLQLYKVQSIHSHCVPNVWGILEPAPALCERVSEEEILVALVPGLSFDSNKHRLGYGKGYYDRLLSSLKASARTYGIGFKEQYSEIPLPTEAHDISLDHLLLF